MIKNIFFPIIKISIHKGINEDTVFIFTGVMTPAQEYIMISIICPKDDGENWVRKELKTNNYEVVLGGFEVIAPT